MLLKSGIAFLKNKYSVTVASFLSSVSMVILSLIRPLFDIVDNGQACLFILAFSLPYFNRERDAAN